MKRSAFLMEWRQWSVAILAMVFLLAGCQTPQDTVRPAPAQATAAGNVSPEEKEGLFRLNDLVMIGFSGIAAAPPRHEERVKEDGTITPSSLFSPVKVVGKTPLQVQRELQELYDRFYRNLTVTVGTEARFFYVSGEVRFPNRFGYAGETTLLGAIATAQGFTDFANKRKVAITRANGQRFTVDCIRALKRSELDLPIYPGDKIDVPRRLW